MTVVVDTNVLPGMFTAGHAFRPIATAWLARKFFWAASTEILLEYEEILASLKGPAMARRILQLIERSGAACGNVVRVTPHFQFLAIPPDRDDDKFADCAITAHADFIITHDKHFQALIGSGYKPQPITPEEFVSQHLVMP